VGTSAGHRRVTGAVALLLAAVGLLGAACVAGGPGRGVGRPIAAPDLLQVSGAEVTRIPDVLAGGVRDRAVDASVEWFLRADIYGNVRWGVGGAAGLLATGYTAADWN
jgi:hypothetical protein